MGPFVVRVRSSLRLLAALLHTQYQDYRLTDEPIADYHATVESPSGVRRWIRPQVRCFIDGYPPFEPLPLYLALPALEWGINWSIATRAHQYLLLHSAAVERNGGAMLFPAWPGHGKSTLCTALIHSGWRLLSDEFGVLRPEDDALLPLPRLIPLKNESRDVIRRFAPNAVIGPDFPGTKKGTIAYVQPPIESIDRTAETAKPQWLVFPRWRKDAALEIEQMPLAKAFLMVATNAFNYEVLGETAYKAVVRLVNSCRCYRLVYSELPEAIEALDELTQAADAR